MNDDTTQRRRPAAGINRGSGAFFIQVPFALIEDARLSTTGKAVYCALARFLTFGTDGGAYPGHARLAQLASCSVSTVQRELKALKELGWVEWQSGAAEGETNRYTVHAIALGGSVTQTEGVGPADRGRVGPPDRQQRDSSTERQLTTRTGGVQVRDEKPADEPTPEERGYVAAISTGLHQGQAHNAKIAQSGAEPRPCSAKWETSLQAARALIAAGVPVAFARDYYQRAGVQYRPTKQQPYIKTLKYPVGGCIKEYQESSAAQVRGTPIIPLVHPVDPAKREKCEPADRRDPSAQAAGWRSLRDVLGVPPAQEA